ncbi:MAG TPA: hypothetical protein VK843_03225 [Planctomycetota bacterium]|nr:hypothetical protein [Planctomycetota bacterium]
MKAITRLAKWVGILLLALSTQSCLSNSVSGWALDEAPRSDVIGVIDGNGAGDALIVQLSNEPSFYDGLYSIPIVARERKERVGVNPSPVRLVGADAGALESMSDDSSRIARLDSAQARLPDRVIAVDGYERRDGALRKIESADRLYFVSVETQIDFAQNTFTPVAVQTGRTDNGDLDERGRAYLPPARRVDGRAIPVLIALPFTLTFDILTLPYQPILEFTALELGLR